MQMHADQSNQVPKRAVLLSTIWILIMAASALADGFHTELLRYKDPYDYWEKNKESLNFGGDDSSYEGDKTGASRNPGLNAQQKRFINELVRGLAFINSTNIFPKEFPKFTRDYNGALTGIAKILVHIGEPAAPYLWEHIQEAVRFTKRSKGHVAKRLEQIQKRMNIINTYLKSLGNAVPPAQAATELAALGKERSALIAHQRQLGYGVSDLKQNRHFVLNLQNILIAIGEPATLTVASGLGHPNKNVRNSAAHILRSIGRNAFPAIVAQLSIKGREQYAGKLLKAMTGEFLGTDAEKWKSHLRKQHIRFPGDPAPGTRPALPQKQEPEKQKSNILKILEKKADSKPRPLTIEPSKNKSPVQPNSKKGKEKEKGKKENIIVIEEGN